MAATQRVTIGDPAEDGVAIDGQISRPDPRDLVQSISLQTRTGLVSGTVDTEPVKARVVSFTVYITGRASLQACRDEIDALTALKGLLEGDAVFDGPEPITYRRCVLKDVLEEMSPDRSHNATVFHYQLRIELWQFPRSTVPNAS